MISCPEPGSDEFRSALVAHLPGLSSPGGGRDDSCATRTPLGTDGYAASLDRAMDAGLMMIVLLDEPGLFVFPSAADAARAIEPIDAESEIRAAFDDSGVPYRVEWVRPNRDRRRLFGLLKSTDPGEYRFVPAGPADPAALIQLLQAHPDSTEPPAAKAHLASLIARLRWRARRP